MNRTILSTKGNCEFYYTKNYKYKATFFDLFIFPKNNFFRLNEFCTKNKTFLNSIWLSQQFNFWQILMKPEKRFLEFFEVTDNFGTRQNEV